MDGALTQIRTAGLSDLETLFRFQLAMASESEDVALDAAALRKGLTAVLRTSALGVYYVAEIDSEVVGCLLVTSEWSDWRNGLVWWIQSVYVDPTLRRRGIYRTLYSHLRRLADESPNVVGIRLYVEKENLAAREVYRNLGMNENRYIVCEWLKTEH